MIVTVEARGRGCDKGLVKAKGFRIAIKIVVSQQESAELCRDRVFYVTT